MNCKKNTGSKQCSRHLNSSLAIVQRELVHLQLAIQFFETRNAPSRLAGRLSLNIQISETNQFSEHEIRNFDLALVFEKS